MGEWERLYDLIRSLSKPIIAALNGVAAGSAFQVSLLCDLRIGHPGVTMGQPEINSGIASVTGPWIMKEMIGIARTIDLTLTGRMLDADECFRIGPSQAFSFSGLFRVTIPIGPRTSLRMDSCMTPPMAFYRYAISSIE